MSRGDVKLPEGSSHCKGTLFARVSYDCGLLTLHKWVKTQKIWIWTTCQPWNIGDEARYGHPWVFRMGGIATVTTNSVQTSHFDEHRWDLHLGPGMAQMRVVDCPWRPVTGRGCPQSFKMLYPHPIIIPPWLPTCSSRPQNLFCSEVSTSPIVLPWFPWFTSFWWERNPVTLNKNTGWWFHTFFPYIGNNHHPNWRTPSFFRGVGWNHQPEYC